MAQSSGTSCGSARAAARWRWRRRAMVRARLAAAHGCDAGADRDRGDPHHRRPHPGPAAGRGRRQGPVHQGDRGGAAARRDRSRRAFVQGHADRAAGGTDARGVSCRARTRATCSSAARRDRIAELPQGATVGTASLRRQALVKRLRPDLRSCRCAATSRRGCASSTRARPTRPCSRSPGLKRLGLADARDRGARASTNSCRRSGRARSASRRAQTMRATRELLAAINHADTFSALACRARLPRRARRLLPHADRRPCDGRGRTAAVSRPDREARRQREHSRSRARATCAMRNRLGADAGARAQAPRRPRFLRRRVTMRLLVTRPEPDGERTAAACARGATRCCWRRCCRSKPCRRRSRRGHLGRRSSSPAPTARGRSPVIPARGELLRLPVLAVGRSSAEAARAAGFADVRLGRRRRGRSRAPRRPALCRFEAAAALSRRRGSRRAIWRCRV